jgi:hypothetical protein
LAALGRVRLDNTRDAVTIRTNLARSTRLATAVIGVRKHVNWIAVSAAAYIIRWAGLSRDGAVLCVTNNIYADSVHVHLAVAAIAFDGPVAGAVARLGYWGVWPMPPNRDTVVRVPVTMVRSLIVRVISAVGAMVRAFAIIMRFIVTSIVMRLVLSTTRVVSIIIRRLTETGPWAQNGKRNIEKVANADTRYTNLTNVTTILSRATSRIVSADTESLALVTKLGRPRRTLAPLGVREANDLALSRHANATRLAGLRLPSAACLVGANDNGLTDVLGASVAVGAFFVLGAWLGAYAHGDRNTSTIQTDLPRVTSSFLGSTECWVVPKLDGCAHVADTHFTSFTLAGSATIQRIGDDLNGVTGSAVAPLARGTSSLRMTAFFVASVADL